MEQYLTSNGSSSDDSENNHRAGELADAIAQDKSLDARISVIARSIKGRITFSTSTGLEDQAVLHAIAKTGAPVDVFALDTGRHFPETLGTIEASERRYDLRIGIVAPDAQSVELLVARDGINGFRQSIEARKACCDARKVQPLKRALKGASGWITGLRREQSPLREFISFCEFDAGLGLLKFNPLADWSSETLAAYVRANNIPVNPLHAVGFPSIGCQPCTRAVRPGEPLRAGRWWWENAEHSECGLHNRAGRTPEVA
jgi:phosphoadenosine phosphosulfate reductase